MNKANLY